MPKKIKLLVCYEIRLADGASLVGDDYHAVPSLTEPALEKIRAAILAREKSTHGDRVTGPCLFRSVTPLK